MMNPAQFILRLAIRFYQRLVSPILTAVFGPLGFGCRFEPTCSHYALGALQEHGVMRGSWLAVRRLARCHPWGGCGPDPVPPRRPGPSSSRAHRHRHATKATEATEASEASCRSSANVRCA